MAFFQHWEGLFSSKIAIAKGILTLFVLEMKLAGLTIYPLFINIGLLIALLLTIWLTAMLLLGYTLTLIAGYNILTGIGIVLVLNMGILFYVIKRLSINLQHMSFEKTRSCLKNNPLSNDYETSQQPLDLNSRSKPTCET